MKHMLNYTLSGSARLVVATLMLLFATESALSGTYYLLVSKNNNNPSSMVSQSYRTTSGNEYSWSYNIDANGTNYYFTVSTSSSYKDMPLKGEGLNPTIKINDNTGLVTASGRQEYNADGTRYYFCYICLSKAATITITYNSTNGEYTISSGSAAADVWYLRGEFTEWKSNQVTFVKDGDTYSASIELPADITYNKGETGKGFKICKNGSTWYGISNTTITSANASTAKSFTNLDGDSYNCGLTTALAGTYIFYFTLSNGNPQLKVTYPSKLPTVPTVRWGKRPSVNSFNIKTSEYIAAQGCNGSSSQTITKMKVRFWKEDGQEAAQTIESATGDYKINTVYDDIITIPSTNSILKSCITETMIYMEVAGYNGTGWSDYSDRVSIPYTADTHFAITTPVNKPFSSCGNRQIAFSEMVSPLPDDFTAKLNNVDVTLTDFSRTGDVITWIPGNKTAGTYTYKLTFSKTGYTPSGEVTFNIIYGQSGPSVDVTDITAEPTATALNPVTPYIPVTLTATLSGELGTNTVEWYFASAADAYRASLKADNPTTTATLKPMSVAAGREIVVNARVISSDCVPSTTVKSYTVSVVADSEPECNQ